jgi:nitroreductase/NAD-dependent dihydropyrimidine dehydrogenase PreA subunit
MPWDDLKPMFRPVGVHVGVYRVDAEKCNHCGLCVQNCPFHAWEMNSEKIPHLKKGYQCFSCSNCVVACTRNAISMVEPYHVDGGFFASSPAHVQYRGPVPPLDEGGKSAEWNPFEKLLLERRSIRNFKTKPVPETLLRRVLEAGRFAPSAGNCQPWKFIVITDKNLIKELNDATRNLLGQAHDTYLDDAKVQELVPIHESIMVPGLWDPRIIVGGMGSFSKGEKPPFLDATAIILLCGDKRAGSGPQINYGICGQNMVLAAVSLGLGACWIGWTGLLNGNPEITARLGIQDPWEIGPSIVVGYPKFKQHGMVSRQYRPVIWFREGSGPGVED